MPTAISYAQRFEDLYLLRAFGDRREGFYIDIGSGHPVYDNMSLAFYLAGWRGITVEPNPWLSRLTRAVRPRDRHIEAVVGASAGETTFYLVDEYHGLSTTIADHAHAAETQFGKDSRPITVPALTLAQLCRQHAVPPVFDFLKVDVEGAEPDVLLNGDWQAFRPKVVVVEALAPYTLAPAWEAWEPFLAAHGYRYVLFDSLNRYYLAQEAGELAPAFESAPAEFDTLQFRNIKPAPTDVAHPDHALAIRLARCAMTRLPLLDPALLFDLITAETPAADLDRPVGAEEIAHAVEGVLGPGAARAVANWRLPREPRLRDVYAALIASDQFRAACGRISASYAW